MMLMTTNNIGHTNQPGLSSVGIVNVRSCTYHTHASWRYSSCWCLLFLLNGLPDNIRIRRLRLVLTHGSRGKGYARNIEHRAACRLWVTNDNFDKQDREHKRTGGNTERNGAETYPNSHRSTLRLEKGRGSKRESQLQSIYFPGLTVQTLILVYCEHTHAAEEQRVSLRHCCTYI